MEPRIPTHDVSTQVIDGAFGRRLKEARLRAGYRSQPALARACNLHVTSVHKHESRRERPSSKAVAAYARVLGVSELYLLHGIEEPAPPPPAPLLPAAVERYLDSVDGKGLDPEVADRLRRVPWSVLVDGEVERWHVVEVRKMIAKNLARRAASTDYAARSSSSTLPLQFADASSHR